MKIPHPVEYYNTYRVEEFEPSSGETSSYLETLWKSSRVEILNLVENPHRLLQQPLVACREVESGGKLHHPLQPSCRDVESSCGKSSLEDEMLNQITMEKKPQIMLYNNYFFE
jgi:hypothetical protein